MALLGFFCDYFLSPPRWRVVKHANACANKESERECTKCGEKERKKKERDEKVNRKILFSAVGIRNHGTERSNYKLDHGALPNWKVQSWVSTPSRNSLDAFESPCHRRRQKKSRMKVKKIKVMAVRSSKAFSCHDDLTLEIFQVDDFFAHWNFQRKICSYFCLLMPCATF